MATLDDFFREQSTISVRGRTFYVRAMSDFDLQAREEFVLKQQAKLRRELNDKNSDAYLTHLDWLDEANDETLLATAVSFESVSLRQKSVAEIPEPIIPFPDDADDAEKQTIIAEREQAYKDTLAKRQAWADEQTEAKRQELAAKTPDELRKLAKRAVIAMQLWTLRSRLTDAYTIYCAVYTDEAFSKRYAETPEKSLEIPAEWRVQLVNAYYEEMERVSMQELKYFLSTDGS